MRRVGREPWACEHEHEHEHERFKRLKRCLLSPRLRLSGCLGLLTPALPAQRERERDWPRPSELRPTLVQGERSISAPRQQLLMELDPGPFVPETRPPNPSPITVPTCSYAVTDAAIWQNDGPDVLGRPEPE